MSLRTINRLFLFFAFLLLSAAPAHSQASVTGCDDGDPCTIDVEDICGNCFHIRVDCAQLICDDGNPCTVDVVDINGNCLHFPKNCDDGDPTTRDFCDNSGNCRHVPVDCDDGDPDTDDYVGPDGQCHHVRNICCDDNNPCTEDSYDPQTGQCVHLPRCDDGDPCTIDYCDPQTGQCINKPKNCDDGNPCTIDYCDPYTGQCVNQPRDCDDGDPCTIDSCHPYTGQCVHKPDPNCTPCQGVNCDDGNPCTIDFCNPYTGACVHKPRNCDDGDPCTIDSCHPYTGQCVHKPDPGCNPNPCYGVNCDDGDPCTIDSCDPYTGACIHTPNPNCQLVCSFTQGFWGNAGGSFNGQTTTQILQGILSNGPVVVGVVGHRSFRVSQPQCVFTLLPGGGNASALPANTGDITVQGPACGIAPIPRYSDGRLQNILAAQTLALALNVRYDPNLASLPLSQACISFPGSVLNSLPANPTILDLLNHANRVLAGLANTTPSTINSAVATVNEYFDECASACVAANSPGGGPAVSPEPAARAALVEGGFQLYPNPTTGEIMADFRQYQGLPATLEVYSMLGSLVHEQQFAELPAEPARINLYDLSNGLYFMKIRIAGEQEVGKEFVISR